MRLYDTNTFQCYVSANAKDQHTGPVTSVSAQSTACLGHYPASSPTHCSECTVLLACVAASYLTPLKVHYTSDGRMYVSSSRDGRIRVRL